MIVRTLMIAINVARITAIDIARITAIDIAWITAIDVAWIAAVNIARIATTDIHIAGISLRFKFFRAVKVAEEGAAHDENETYSGGNPVSK
jgi:hypothetical protein